MANSVVRLSIDSHEFDANIKRAGEALNKFFDQARKGDRTFEVLDDDAMEVIKSVVDGKTVEHVMYLGMELVTKENVDTAAHD